MDFSVSDRVRELGAKMRLLVDTAVIPLEGKFFAEGFAAVAVDLEHVRAEVRAQGLWAPQLALELGGLGLTLLEFGQVSRELGRSPLGHFVCNCQAPDAGNMEVLAEFADAEQRQRFLMPLIRARDPQLLRVMTEPDLPGSNPRGWRPRRRSSAPSG